MHDLAVEQISYRREPDMWVWADVDAGTGLEHGRSHMVEENERPDHPRLRRRQRPMNHKAAEICRTRHNDMGDRVA